MNNQKPKSGIFGQRKIKGLSGPFALVSALVILLACFSGCGASKNQNYGDSSLTKIADNLYEISYTADFDWKNAKNPDVSAFACSGVQNGQYRGRNYDWVYADTDICVVHAAVSENRPHASVGVSDLSLFDNGKKSYDLGEIPFATVDGINDAGVCIQVNVLPYGENGKLSHTKTKKDDLAGVGVVRYILDYADSVEDAISLLKEKDIHSELQKVNELHWLISGPASNTDTTTRTVVVEVFPDGLHITENFVNDKPIMTNFNISNFDGSVESVGFGTGYERWQLLNENFDHANSITGTFELMETVDYSKFYDLYCDPFWYSEFNGVDLGYLYKKRELKALLGKDVFNYYKEKYGGVYYNAALYDGEKALNGDIEKAGILKPAVQINTEWYETKTPGDGNIWITVFTSVYDLDNLTLDIRVRESREHLHFTIK